MLQFHLQKQIRPAHFGVGFASHSYTRRMACTICETRRPRRFCPGVRGDICTLCCGAEREVSVTCPLDCEYLRDAHKHEKAPEIDESQVPNRDIKVTERFLEEHEALLMVLGGMLYRGAMDTDAAVDYDVREALEALVRTYRTLQSGVYYETVPPNPLAAAIYRSLQHNVAELRRHETQQEGISKTRDTDILGMLVFLQRLEYDRNNGRKRGRAFLGFLGGIYAAGPEPAAAPPSLILP